jgi:hypothetical protein
MNRADMSKSDEAVAIRVHSDTAWNLASKFSGVLASETRDLAALIDALLVAERERCAKIADAYVRACGSVNGRLAGETIANTIRAQARD